MRTARLASSVRCVTERAVDTDFKLGLDGIESHTGRLLDTASTDFDGEGIAFAPGDLLFGKLRPYLRKVWLADRSGAAVGDFIVLRPKPNAAPRFLRYLLLSDSFIGPINASVTGAKMPRTDWTEVKDSRCYLPPLQDQCAIADYLDTETTRIDEMIAAHLDLALHLSTRLDSVLQSLIPAPTRPGENAWPARSLVRAVHSIVDYRGATPTKVDHGVQLITARNVKNGYIDYECSVEFVDEDAYSGIMRRGVPAIDDLLMTMEAPLGNVALVDDGRIALAQRVIKLRAASGVSPRFLRLAMMAPDFQGQLRSLATGSTALGIKAAKLHQLQIVVPALDEQNRIVAIAEREERLLKEAVEAAHGSIGLMQERRAALITAAVTGGIDPYTGREITPNPQEK